MVKSSVLRHADGFEPHPMLVDTAVTLAAKRSAGVTLQVNLMNLFRHQKSKTRVLVASKIGQFMYSKNV